jgi:hypothetical protein
VTDQKAREEQIHLLMREISHRGEPEDFMECFTDRIQALAANQDLLVQNEWQGVDVEDLVRAQLAHFADLVGSRITVRGSPERGGCSSDRSRTPRALRPMPANTARYLWTPAVSTWVGGLTAISSL